MITIEALSNIKAIVNLKALSRESGVSYSTMVDKLSNNRELTITESRALAWVLNKYGLRYTEEQPPIEPKR